jgi:hypothetical protein
MGICLFFVCVFFFIGQHVRLVCDPIVLTVEIKALEIIRSEDLLLPFLDADNQSIKYCEKAG